MGELEQSQGNFELIFEGPSDDSASTLQRIKGVFVADLELPIPEIQRILTEAPTAIRQADDEAELKFAFQRLKSAGAKVLIVRKGASPEATEHPEEFSFEFDLNETAPPVEAPKKTRVYSLEIDDETVDPLSEVAHLLREETDESTEDSEDEQPDQTELSVLPEASTVPELSDSGSMPPPIEPAGSTVAMDSNAESTTRETPSGATVPPPVRDVTDASLTTEPENLQSLTLDDPLPDSALQSVDVQHTETQAAPDPAAEANIDISGISILSDDELAEFHRDRGVESQSHEAVQDFGLQLDDVEDLVSSLDLTEPQEGPLDTTAPSGSLEPEIDLTLTTEPPPSPLPEPDQAPAERVATTDSALSLDDELPQEDSSPKPSSTGRGTTPATPPAPPELPELDVAVTQALESAPAAAPPSHALPSAVKPEAATPHAETVAAHSPAPLMSNAGAEPAVSAIETPVTTPKLRSKKKLPLDVAVPITLGCLVLGIANYFYFSNARPLGPRLPDPVVINGIEKRGAPVLPRPRQLFAFNETTPSRATEGSVSLIDQKFHDFELTWKASPPRERTKEEIVSGIHLPPWVRKFELKANIFEPTSAPHTIEGKATALVYLEYQGEPFRVGVPATIRLTRDPESAAVHARVEAQSSKSLSSNESLSVSRRSDGTFAIWYRTEFELKLLPPASVKSPPLG